MSTQTPQDIFSKIVKWIPVSKKTLGVIVVSFFAWYLKNIDVQNESKEKIREQVITQCNEMRNNLVNDIDACLGTQPKNTSAQQKERYILRANLITTTNTYASEIPPEIYFSIPRLTRFDSSYAAYNICSLKKHELVELRNILSTYCVFNVHWGS